jgi:hypothetical protein
VRGYRTKEGLERVGKSESLSATVFESIHGVLGRESSIGVPNQWHEELLKSSPVYKALGRSGLEAHSFGQVLSLETVK